MTSFVNVSSMFLGHISINISEYERNRKILVTFFWPSEPFCYILSRRSRNIQQNLNEKLINGFVTDLVALRNSNIFAIFFSIKYNFLSSTWFRKLSN